MNTLQAFSRGSAQASGGLSCEAVTAAALTGGTLACVYI